MSTSSAPGALQRTGSLVKCASLTRRSFFESLSYVISNESWFPQATWMNQFRLRSAYGASGRQPGPTDAAQYYTTLVTRLDALIAGSDSLMADVPEPLRSLARSQLEDFRAAALPSFDLRGASVGNLMLTGGYLAGGRDIDPVLLLLAKLIEARGEVRPVVTDDLHLQATLQDGSVLVGQHRITGNGVPPPSAAIVELSLVRSLEDPTPASVAAPAHVASLIRGADVICFPVGSFFTSVIANLLPRGIGRAIAEAECPKVFVPNAGNDPEMRGMSVASKRQSSQITASTTCLACRRSRPASPIRSALIRNWSTASARSISPEGLPM